jgi:SAM-dependent methyltransferase
VQSAANSYSARWFAIFLETVPMERTALEVDFLSNVLPLETHRRVLDLACGPGRHALSLAQRGYTVTGWDRDPDAIAAARFAAVAEDLRDARFEVRDVRTLSSSDGPFDAVTSMWSSFGWFDAAGNRDLLGRMAGALRPGGLLVLDVYDAAFFDGRTGERLHARAGTAIRERTELDGDRLSVELRYSDGEVERFEWQVFTAAGLRALAARFDLQVVLSCAEFDPNLAADGSWPRMQWVFATK